MLLRGKSRRKIDIFDTNDYQMHYNGFIGSVINYARDVQIIEAIKFHHLPYQYHHITLSDCKYVNRKRFIFVILMRTAAK